MAKLLLLLAAIIAEVIGTLALKGSAGFSRLWPSTIVVLGYGVAFLLLAQVLHLGMPVGTAYAIWASVGVALVAVAGRFVFGEILTVQSIVGIGFIIVGVVLVETSH